MLGSESYLHVKKISFAKENCNPCCRAVAVAEEKSKEFLAFTMAIANQLKKHSKFKQIIRFAPITLLILFSFFVRGMTPEEVLNLPINISSSYISVAITLIISLSLFFELMVSKTRPNIRHWTIYCLLVIFILFSFLWNIFFISPEKSLRFTVELLSCIGLVLIVYLYIRDLNAVSIVYRIIMVLGGITALYILIVLFPRQEHIHRIVRVKGAEHLGLGGANHTAHVLAIAAIISLIAFFNDRKRLSRIFDLIILALLVPIVLLTATRTALYGLVSSAIIFAFLFRRTSKAFSAILIICLLLLLPSALAYLGFHKIAPNLSRYTPEHFFAVSVGNRLAYMFSGIEHGLESTSSFLFGAGMYRYSRFGHIDYATATLYPHNIYIDMLAFVGFPAMLLLLIKVFTLFKKLSCLILAVHNSTDVNSIFVINCTFFYFFIAVMYSFVEGQITRILTLWIIIGLAERVINIFGKVNIHDG